MSRVPRRPERKTEALTQMIAYSLSDKIAVVRLQSPPVNAIGLPMLEQLRAAIARAAEDAAVQGIIITGSEEHFSAGADVAIFQDIRGGDDALRVSRLFQEAFQAIEDSPKPVAAAVAGHVMGGGLELAMACHFRVAATGSRLSMPEIKLGFNPGAGGTQRLPRLVGTETALDMLLTGQPIDVARALDLGLIDAVCPAEGLVATAVSLLQSGQAIRRTGDRANQARVRFLRPKTEDQSPSRPELIAPQKIIEAVRTGIEQGFVAGLAREQECFRDCMATLATQNKIYVFCAGRQAGKLPSPPTPLPERARGDAGPSPPPLLLQGERGVVGVVGMGTMGTGIAQALIASGIPVVACDESPAALERAGQKIRASIENRVRQGKATAAEAERTAGLLTTATDWRPLAAAPLVIEAVFEDVEVKRTAIARLEETCSPETIIATNTSTINLDVLAALMRRPERLVGMHFFHPAQRMPLVEVVRRETTPPLRIPHAPREVDHHAERDEYVLAAAVQLAKAIRKTPVVVRNREGFVVSRLFVPYLKEAFWLLEEGAEPAAIDRAMVAFGFSMGPLQAIDMSGLDILALTDAVLRRAFPYHGPLPPVAQRLVEAGQLGQKTGAGVYRYESGDHTPRPSDAAAKIIAAARGARRVPACGWRAAVPDDKEIARRLMLRMVAEAFRVLEEGIVDRPSDIDVAMVLGTGLGDFRGGPVKYAQDLGLDRVATELDELTARCGERFAVCELLRRGACGSRANA